MPSNFFVNLDNMARRCTSLPKSMELEASLGLNMTINKVYIKVLPAIVNHLKDLFSNLFYSMSRKKKSQAWQGFHFLIKTNSEFSFFVQN